MKEYKAKRHWFSGRTSDFQSDGRGSIPLWRINKMEQNNQEQHPHHQTHHAVSQEEEALV